MGAYRATDIMPQTKKFGIVIALQDVCVWNSVFAYLANIILTRFLQQAVTDLSAMKYVYFLMACETKGSVADFLSDVFERLPR